MRDFKRALALIVVLVVVLVLGFSLFSGKRNQVLTDTKKEIQEELKQIPEEPKNKAGVPGISPAEINFVGPRENIPADTPSDYGFWSFAVSDPGKLSRSGQPTMDEFRWLKNNGWVSVVDLRNNGEHGETANDQDLAGFNDLGFNYLHLPIVDGSPPTNDQAKTFLDFVTKPENQPVHVHCRAGYGRTGTMVALYRYSVQGWPMEKAIEESRLFKGGINDRQAKWLEDWAKNNPPLNK